MSISHFKFSGNSYKQGLQHGESLKVSIQKNIEIYINRFHSEAGVQKEELLNKSFEIGSLMAENPDRQLRMTKELLTVNAVTSDIKAAEELETKFLQQCWETEEHEEAVKAFSEKRKPRFR